MDWSTATLIPHREQIADGIANEQSPVGIDAKKSHVMILYMLEEIDKRLARVEENIAAR